MTKDIKVISFDLDDTLWPITSVINQAQTVFENWLAENYAQLMSQGLLSILAEKQEVVRQSAEGHCLTHVRKESLRLALAHAGIDSAQSQQAAEDAFDAFHAARNAVTPFEGVAQLLSRLRSQYRLVSLTNGNVDLSQTPLNNYFDLNLNPEVVGTRKPDDRMFLTICEHFQVKPSQVLHVGDHYEEDVMGAKAAGLQALWVVHMLELESFWPERKARMIQWLDAHKADPQVPFVSSMDALSEHLENLS